MKSSQNNWLPVWMKKDTESLCFSNKIPAVEFVNELLKWIDETNLGVMRKDKYKHFIRYYSLSALSANNNVQFNTLWDYVTWLSNKIKKPLPDEVISKFVAYSL